MLSKNLEDLGWWRGKRSPHRAQAGVEQRTALFLTCDLVRLT